MKMIATDNAHCDTVVTEILWNPVDVYTIGICHSVCIIQVSVLKMLNYMNLSSGQMKLSFYEGVCIKRVSTEQGY